MTVQSTKQLFNNLKYLACFGLFHTFLFTTQLHEFIQSFWFPLWETAIVKKITVLVCVFSHHFFCCCFFVLCHAKCFFLGFLLSIQAVANVTKCKWLFLDHYPLGYIINSCSTIFWGYQIFVSLPLTGLITVQTTVRKKPDSVTERFILNLVGAFQLLPHLHGYV